METRTFACPQCAAALTVPGDAKMVRCAYCGSEVVVPPDLRGGPSGGAASSGVSGSPQAGLARSALAFGIAGLVTSIVFPFAGPVFDILALVAAAQYNSRLRAKPQPVPPDEMRQLRAGVALAFIGLIFLAVWVVLFLGG